MVKGSKICHTDINQKEAGVAILTSEKVYSRPKKITRDRERRYLMIKGSIHRGDIAIQNMCAPKKAAKYVKKKITKTKVEIHKSIMVAVDFNNLLSTIDRTIGQKISKGMEI